MHTVEKTVVSRYSQYRRFVRPSRLTCLSCPVNRRRSLKSPETRVKESDSRTTLRLVRRALMEWSRSKQESDLAIDVSGRRPKREILSMPQARKRSLSPRLVLSRLDRTPAGCCCCDWAGGDAESQPLSLLIAPLRMIGLAVERRTSIRMRLIG